MMIFLAGIGYCVTWTLAFIKPTVTLLQHRLRTFIGFN